MAETCTGNCAGSMADRYSPRVRHLPPLAFLLWPAVSAGLFSRYGRSFSAGNSQIIYQVVDLTGMAGIAFDVRLAAYGSTTLANFLRHRLGQRRLLRPCVPSPLSDPPGVGPF